MEIETLPYFVYDKTGACKRKHFLDINRDEYGGWSACYACYHKTGETRPLSLLFFNGALDLTEVAIRMQAKLDRYNRTQSATPLPDSVV